MSADLMLRLSAPVLFSDVLDQTRVVLVSLLKVASIGSLLAELPHSEKAAGIRLPERLVDSTFPGAYVRFSTDEQSIVHFGVFEGGSKGNLLIGFGSVSTPASQVLTAGLAAATALLMHTTIIDSGTHWLDKEEYQPAELISELAVEESPSDLPAAIVSVHNKQSSRKRRIGQ